MELNRGEREKLQAAIGAAYGLEDLARFLDYKLDKDVQDFAGPGAAKGEVVRVLLQRASQQGWIDELLARLREDTGNPMLLDTLKELSASARSRRSAGRVLLPSAEADVVTRTKELNRLVDLLLEAARERPAAAVALHAPGGFGKTTLAILAVRASELAKLFEDFLWVETGQACTSSRVVQLISDLCVHLGERRPALTDPDQIGFHLAEVLEDRRVLLVIDNVWSAQDLAPFLMGGPRCVRLVTTRNARVCPPNTKMMHLGAMSADQIDAVLRRSLPGVQTEGGELDLSEVAGLCGGWPLLAKVLGSSMEQEVEAGAPVKTVVAETRKELLVAGPGAFDVLDSSQRLSAISQVMRSSLDQLEAQVTIGAHGGLREKYQQLGIFPAAVPIPVEVLEVWWGHTSGWSPRKVRRFCSVLADRALVDSYLADRHAVVLHDVFRAYLRTDFQGNWAEQHRSLVESFAGMVGGDWCALPERYAYLWRHLSHHLAEAGLVAETVGLLSDPRFVVAKVQRWGPESLVFDRAVLDVVGKAVAAEDVLCAGWQVASVLTGAGHLLHGLTRDSDIAATLLAAAMRAGVRGPSVESLRSMVSGKGSALETQWAIAPPPRPVGEGLEPGHVGAVTDVSVVDTTLVSAGEDGTVHIWALSARRRPQVLLGHTGWVFAVALSPNGMMIASAGEDAVVRLWERQTHRLSVVMVAHTQRVRALSFDSQGKRLLSGSEDGRVCVWDVARQEMIRELSTPGTPVWSVAVSPDDTVVAVAGQDAFVRLFSLTTGELLDEKAVHRDWVRSVSFAPQGALLASGSGDGTVCVWSVADRALVPLRSLDAEGHRVRSVQLSATSGRVMAACEDAVIRVWDATGLMARRPMPAGVDWIRSIQAMGDAAMAAGCEDGGVRVWRRDPDRLEDVGFGANGYWSAAFSARTGMALLGSGDGLIEVRQAASGVLAHTMSAGRGRVWDLAAGGEVAAAACVDGSVRVWDVTSGAEVAQFTPPEPRTWAVALSQSGIQVAATMGLGMLRLWELASGRLLWERRAHSARIRSLVFDEGSGALVTGSGDGLVRVWDVDSGEMRAEFTSPGGWIRAVAADGPGRIVLGCGNGEIYVWDRTGKTDPIRLSGHSGRVLMVAFLPDDDGVISAAADGTVRVWSTEAAAPISEVRCDSSLLTGSADPERRMVLVSSAVQAFAIQVNRAE